MAETTHKKIKDICTRELITIDADETLDKAGKLMEEKRVSMLVVTEKEKIVGILTAGAWFNSFYLHVGSHLPQTRFRTERPALLELQKEKQLAVKKRAEEFKKSKVRDVMNRHFKTINENATLTDATHEMKSTELRRLLVVDDHEKIIGVLGRTKTILALLEELS
ncbi:MAG: CBS domain-containing protein [Candidatus Micrarchaeota archaeon]